MKHYHDIVNQPPYLTEVNIEDHYDHGGDTNGACYG